MAGSQEMTSSFVEGLEDISEEEQLKMALEMSKNDVYGQSSEFDELSIRASILVERATGWPILPHRARYAYQQAHEQAA